MYVKQTVCVCAVMHVYMSLWYKICVSVLLGMYACVSVGSECIEISLQ